MNYKFVDNLQNNTLIYGGCYGPIESERVYFDLCKSKDKLDGKILPGQLEDGKCLIRYIYPKSYRRKEYVLGAGEYLFLVVN